MKYFRMGREEIIWDLSYSSLLMYMACIPSYATDPEIKNEVIEHDSLDDIAHLI